MANNVFNPMEIDAIGEIMNISLGSSATAISNLLNHRVDITTPRVSVVTAGELDLYDLDSVVGVEIHYVSGLEGSNIMVLKRPDVKAIVDILMGSEMSEEEFELNELTLSAVCEVMNQMMGAASTALSDFLGRMINISTPQSFELSSFAEYKEGLFPPSNNYVVVRFTLTIEDTLESEFVNVFSAGLARELIAGFGLEDMDSYPIIPMEEESGGPMTKTEVDTLIATSQAAEPAAGGGKLDQSEIEKLLAGGVPEPPAPPAPAGGKLDQSEIEKLLAGAAAEPPAAPASESKLSQDELDRLLQSPAAAPQPQAQAPAPPAAYPPGAYPPMDGNYPQPGGAYPPYPYPPYPPHPGYYYPAAPEPKVINTQSVSLPHMDLSDKLGQEQSQNLDLIMSVPLEISVEIGRTRRKVQDILSFSKGSLVVLDRLAGEQVDLYVNGQCIAKGDVVVIDDNFGLRITEVLKPPEPVELLQL